jgi:predicted Zn-dependent protease
MAAVVLMAILALGAGCATNPVTGRREVQWVSESTERRLGESSYQEAQQTQGGVYTADPGVVRYVQGVARELWRASDRPGLPYDIVVLNNGVPNAWALPGGKMAINRGLLSALDNEAELAAVLSHEIVHVAARHGAQSIERGTMMQAGLGLLGLGLELGGVDERDLITRLSGTGAALADLKFSRDDELEADRYGIRIMVRAGYDPQAAVAVQELFLRMAEGNDPGWLAGLLSTHPPSRERVTRNRATAGTYPPTGFVGREEYHRAMAPLTRAAPAYEAFESGMKALRRQAPAEALDLARRAIAIEPREGHFHALAGKALADLNRETEALRSLDEAIRLNDRYFAYYLLRGRLYQAAGNAAAARRDLQQSVQLLPTAAANYNLGALNLERGRPREAQNRLRAASSAASSDGSKARVLLTRVEIAERPDAYLGVTYVLDPHGGLALDVHNASPLDVTTCTIALRLQGRKDWVSFDLPHGAPARRTTRLITTLGPFRSVDDALARVDYRFDRVEVAPGGLRAAPR